MTYASPSSLPSPVWPPSSPLLSLSTSLSLLLYPRSVYSIGLNSFAQCGFPIPTPPDLLLSPQHVKHLPPGKVTKVLYIQRENFVSGNFVHFTTQPIYIADSHANNVQVCCGLDHTHFLSSEGFLFSCGWSDDGQTGNASIH